MCSLSTTGNCSAGDYAVMPGMDGPDLVAECRQHWPDLPVIILTTLDDTTIIRRFLAAGAGLLSSLGGWTGDISRAQNIILSQKNSGSLPLRSSCAASDKTAIFHASPGAAKSSKWYILMNTNQTGRIIVDLKEPFLTAWVNDDCCA